MPWAERWGGWGRKKGVGREERQRDRKLEISYREMGIEQM
jgi:hypothetical protein